jgi:hypothetical protein
MEAVAGILQLGDCHTTGMYLSTDVCVCSYSHRCRTQVIVLLVLLGLICAMTLHSAWCVLPVFTLCTMGRQETLAAAAQYLANMER